MDGHVYGLHYICRFHSQVGGISFRHQPSLSVLGLNHVSSSWLFTSHICSSVWLISSDERRCTTIHSWHRITLTICMMQLRKCTHGGGWGFTVNKLAGPSGFLSFWLTVQSSFVTVIDFLPIVLCCTVQTGVHFLTNTVQCAAFFLVNVCSPHYSITNKQIVL